MDTGAGEEGPGDGWGGEGPTVRAQAVALPIDTDSADLVVLPHVLEFEAHPHQALREAHRVLVAEGHLLVFGFNPWSLLGAARWVARRRRQAPWCGHFLDRRRLRDWLQLLGFDVLAIDGCFYRPPLVSASLLARLSVFERAAVSMAPLLGGSYMMLARKRVVTLTPVRPRWRVPRRMVPVGVPGGSAARTSSGD